MICRAANSFPPSQSPPTIDASNGRSWNGRDGEVRRILHRSPGRSACAFPIRCRCCRLNSFRALYSLPRSHLSSPVSPSYSLHHLLNGFPSLGSNAWAQLDDDALTGGIAGGIGDDPNAVNVTGILSHDYGSDGAGTTLLTADGAVLPAALRPLSTRQGTVLTIHQVSTNLDVLQVSLSNTTDGSYTVTQLNPVSHPAGGDENNLQFSINYVVTDGNGDKATGSFSIDVDDDTPTVSGNNLVQLDDDALAGGNLGGTGDDANAVNATGTLAHSYGADGAGTTLLSGTGAPAGFTYALSNGGQTLTISQDSTGLNVLQITLTNTADGSYAVSQLNPISHPVGSAENNVEFTVTYQVTDKDGDAALGTLSVNVDDDTPTRLTRSRLSLRQCSRPVFPRNG